MSHSHMAGWLNILHLQQFKQGGLLYDTHDRVYVVFSVCVVYINQIRLDAI